MFSALFTLVAAWPTPATIAAVMPAQHPFADPEVAWRELLGPSAVHAVRRRTTASWSRQNADVVRIPAELLAAAEVADVVASPPA